METEFWVIHRRREYGPFDYQWSQDLHGMEMIYRGEKFGEYCGSQGIYADLKPFKLPMRVVEVTSVVMGSLLYGVLNGLTATDKRADLVDRLVDLGFEKFTQHIEHQ